VVIAKHFGSFGKRNTVLLFVLLRLPRIPLEVHDVSGNLTSTPVGKANSTPVSGSRRGIEFPLDLERFDALLGIDAAPWNARDSIRYYDYVIETYMALALMHSTLGCIAMDS